MYPISKVPDSSLLFTVVLSLFTLTFDPTSFGGALVEYVASLVGLNGPPADSLPNIL